MAAIVGPGGPSIATKSAIDGWGGPVVARDHLWRDSSLQSMKPSYYSLPINALLPSKTFLCARRFFLCFFHFHHTLFVGMRELA